MNLKNTLLALLMMSSSLWGQAIITNTNGLTNPWSPTFGTDFTVPSGSSAFLVSASNLTTNITVAISDSTNWQVSTNNSNFTDTVLMASNASNESLWIRMNGSNVGRFTNIISLTSIGTNGTNISNVTNTTTVTGIVVGISTNTNNLTVPWSNSFSGFQGQPSGISRAFRVIAFGLNTNIAVTLSDSTNWQVSTNNTTFTNTLSMASNSSNALLWVRMSGSNVGTFTNIISLTSVSTNGTNTNNVTNTTTITGTMSNWTSSVMFDKATALIVRPTNLGATTNITFVDAATNTNTISISNGIIKSWTQ
jgi:hypothetical protein